MKTPFSSTERAAQSFTAAGATEGLATSDHMASWDIQMREGRNQTDDILLNHVD